MSSTRRAVKSNPLGAAAGRLCVRRLAVRWRFLFALLLGLSSVLTQAAAETRVDWQPPEHGVAVELPSCQAADAFIVRHPYQLRMLRSTRYRVFCIAPGDYRSAGEQELFALSGRAGAPRVIRLLDAPSLSRRAFAQAPEEQLALLPPLHFRESHHWLLSQLAFVDIDTRKGSFPLRFFNSSHVVMDNLRVQRNRHGIEFHHLSHDIVLQHSLIGDMDMDAKHGNDAVCVALEGRRTDRGLDAETPVIRNIRIVHNEIYNCNDGVQLIWNKGHRHQPDFAGTLIAGNDIYIDAARRSNCNGQLDPKGDCACTENAVDIKAGSPRADQPVVIRHNRFYGWRNTDSRCNPDADSWGTAISVHYEAAQHLRIEENIFWDVVSGVALTHDSHHITVANNLFYGIPKVGAGNGIAIVSYDTVDEVVILANQVVDAHSWLSLRSNNTNLSCNVISDSGRAAGVLRRGGSAWRNSYYRHSEPRFRGAGDLRLSRRSRDEEVELCSTAQPLSSPRRFCLSGAFAHGSIPVGCGQSYWLGN